MKKILAFFLVFALAGAVFADEPSAEAKVAEFKGDAAVTFGVDLDTNRTGFKNKVDGSIKLNLLNGGDKSTTGDGIWGELKLKINAFTLQAKADKNVNLLTKIDDDDVKVEIDTAKIHVGPAYVGIKKGDLNYGSNFWYPNALNYKDSDDEYYNRTPSDKVKYDQGLVLGYEQKDLFKVETAFRSQKDTGKKLDYVKTEFSGASGYKVKEDDGVWTDPTDAFKADKAAASYVAKDATVPANTLYYVRVMKDGDTNYWTDKYALGVYGEVKPIKDLRVAIGTAYVFGRLSGDKDVLKAVRDSDNRGDITFFTGADYKLALLEKFVVNPMVTYTMYADAKWNGADEKLYYPEDLKTSMLKTGVRFGWGEEKKSNSLLYDFFGKNTLVYDTNKEDKGDDKLLPGVSLFSAFDLVNKNIETKLPIMMTFYSGELVKGLNVAALVHANVAKDASEISRVVPGTVYAGRMTKADYERLIGAKGLQIGLAASYDVKLNDITIVPAAGMLWTHGMLKGEADTRMTADEFKVEAKVDVKGVIQNTTFSVFWDEAAFGKGTSKEWTFGVKHDEQNYYTLKNGMFGLKAKIAL